MTNFQLLLCLLATVPVHLVIHNWARIRQALQRSSSQTVDPSQQPRDGEWHHSQLRRYVERIAVLREGMDSAMLTQVKCMAALPQLAQEAEQLDVSLEIEQGQEQPSADLLQALEASKTVLANAKVGYETSIREAAAAYEEGLRRLALVRILLRNYELKIPVGLDCDEELRLLESLLPL